MYRHSSPQPHRHHDIHLLAELAREKLRPPVRQVDAELVHDLDDLGMDALGWSGAGRHGGVLATGRALEQRLTHLRASGVMQAEEQDVRPGRDRHTHARRDRRLADQQGARIRRGVRGRQGTDWYVSRQGLGVEGHDTDRI
jgi:hypothetical protein